MKATVVKTIKCKIHNLTNTKKNILHNEYDDFQVRITEEAR